MIHPILFYLLLFLLPIQFGYHFWPEWSMVLGRRIDFLSPTLFLTDILLVFLFVVWLVETKFSALRLVYAKRFFIFIATIFIGLNVILSQSPPLAFYTWIKFLECIFLVWYIVVTKSSQSLALMSLSGAILYSSLIAIGQFALQHSVGGIFWFLGERTFTIDTPGIARSVIGGQEFLRAYATFPHPNVLGGCIATILPLLVSEYMNKRISHYAKKMYVITIALGIVALILSFSRSAWIIFGLSAAWIWFKKSKYYMAVVLAACVMASIFFVIPFSSIDESVVVRNQLNASAISIIQKFPLFGVGLGNFLVTLPQVLPSRAIYFLQPVHNIYLLLFSEIGIIGVGTMWWITYSLLGRKKILYSPIFISLMGLLLLGLVDHYPFTLQQGRLLLALLVGLCLCGNDATKRQALG